MDFFEPPPPPPDRDRERHAPPPWFQPPDDVLATLVPDRRILARSGPLAVMLSHIDAYPIGCRLHVRILARRPDDMDQEAWWDLHDLMFGDGRHRHRPGRRTLPDTLLRFGVQYRDGTKATTVGGPQMPHQQEQEPQGPVLQDHGGGGGGGDEQIGMNRPLWLWPLPPPEPFDLVLEWPAVGLDLTRVQVDGDAITDAARRCQPLFAPTQDG